MQTLFHTRKIHQILVRLSDKATQTSEDDFGKCNGTNDMKRKYEINIKKRLDLTANDDQQKPYFTSVAWIDENNFVAVDAGNAKLKIYSLLSGKILKEVKISEPLTVSVWDEGIACLSKVNKLTTLTRDLHPQQTVQNVTSLFSSPQSSNQLTWIEDMNIFIQKKRPELQEFHCNQLDHSLFDMLAAFRMAPLLFLMNHINVFTL